ncbi:MAG TPA: hypothetical protein VLD38_01115 [Nitrosopumilaceae archaeon]|nr:hypothetical protein [Nitrosopumilaceae archaeon]
MTFFVFGISSGLLILYDYLQSPHLISKEQAFAIATGAGNWSRNFLDDKTVDMKLLHVKTSEFAFRVDEKTLKEIAPFCPQKSPCIEPYEINGHGLEEGQYVWMVTVTGQPPAILSGRTWGFIIDAKNGQVLQG